MKGVSPHIHAMIRGSVRDELHNRAMRSMKWRATVQYMTHRGWKTVGDSLKHEIGQTPFHTHGVISLRAMLHWHE